MFVAGKSDPAKIEYESDIIFMISLQAYELKKRLNQIYWSYQDKAFSKKRYTFSFSEKS